MKLILGALALVGLMASSAVAKNQTQAQTQDDIDRKILSQCGEDAKNRTIPLFRLQVGEDVFRAYENSDIFNGKVVLKNAISVNGKLYSVLETEVTPGKMGEYRLHFIYILVDNSCELMGQEILNMSNF